MIKQRNAAELKSSNHTLGVYFAYVNLAKHSINEVEITIGFQTE